MAPRDGTERIGDILAAIDDIRADTDGLDFASFSKSAVTIRSVLYSIAVIGEAVKHIPEETRQRHPDIPWRAIAGMRDRVVHEYFRTNVRRVWDVVTDDLDPLESALRQMADRLGNPDKTG